jgi:hypothetical protein
MRDAAKWIQEGNQRRDDWSRDGITEFILPTLSRFGVLTPRIEQKFAQARFTPALSSRLTAQLDSLVDVEPAI